MNAYGNLFALCLSLIYSVNVNLHKGTLPFYLIFYQAASVKPPDWDDRADGIWEEPEAISLKAGSSEDDPFLFGMSFFTFAFVFVIIVQFIVCTYVVINSLLRVYNRAFVRKNTPLLSPTDGYDVIIVGAGPAGRPIPP